LLDESLRQNAVLKTYNTQMAQRMQERDEDLAAAYAEIESVKKQRNKVALAFAIAVAAASVCAYMAIAKR
jgi:tellurite resistance protein